MKKLLLVVLTVLLSFTLAGCVENGKYMTEMDVETEINEYIERHDVEIDALLEEIQLYIDENDEEILAEIDLELDILREEIGEILVGFAVMIDERIDEMEPIERTQMERFITDFFIYAIADGEMTFIELDTEYTETVEAYGYGTTYIYEALEPMTINIYITTDNDLELCWYEEGLMGEAYDCTDLVLTGNAIRVDIPAGFFAFDTESWYMDNDSNITVVVREVE